MAFNFKGNLRLSTKLRKELSRPFGKIVDNSAFKRSVKKNARIYAIGDVTVAALLEMGYKPRVAIFDYRSERARKVFISIRKRYESPITVRNKRGFISRQMWSAVGKASSSGKGVGIRIYGEEDLAALACIHFAKVGDIIVYGMRGKGMALVRVTKAIKSYIDSVIVRMSGQ